MPREIICGIYKIVTPTYKIYIGQSINIYLRWWSYKSLKCKLQHKLYRSLVKHGVENHKFEILEECLRELLNEREKYWIKFYDTFDSKHGLNLRSGGGQNNNLSKDVIEKIKKSVKKTTNTKEFKQNCRDRNIGRKASEKTKLKMSLNRKGRKSTTVYTDEIRKNISEAHKGKRLSEEHKKKIGLKSLGFKHSEKSKKKMSEKKKGIRFTEEHKRKLSLAKVGYVPWNKKLKINCKSF